MESRGTNVCSNLNGKTIITNSERRLITCNAVFFSLCFYELENECLGSIHLIKQ